MERKKLLILMNGVAGTGLANTHALDIIAAFAREGCESTVYPILPSEGLTAEKILEEVDGRFDLAVCIGGDGTLNHAINGMMHMHHRPVLGYIPSGSTNDFAKGIGIPADLMAQCKTIAGHNSEHYDIGRLNDRYFNYIAAFGAFTSISYDTSQTFKNAIGHAAYMIKAIMSIPQNFRYSCHLTMTHDGVTEERDALFGCISNTTSMGGFEMPFSEHVKLSDGIFEVMIIKTPPMWIEINQILTALLSGNTNNPYIEVFQTREITFDMDEETAWTVDGEYGGSYKHAAVNVEHKAIEIMLPTPDEKEKMDAASQPIFPE
jgi:YegS/Rv2252/BmrU family lipid kinase